MKEAVGEGSMTLVTIVLVGAAIAALTSIIGFLIGSQGRRASCENSGYSYSNGKCKDGDKVCTYDKSIKDFICG